MRNSYRRDPLLWLLVALAFIVRIAYNLALHPDGHPPGSFVIDETEYFGAAHVLAEGRGFSYFDTALWVRPPLYVASLAVVMRVAGDGYIPALIFQALLSALTLPALGWLAFRVGGRKAARWTLLLALLYLPLTLFAGLLLSETLFVLLFAWSLVALVLARERLDGVWDWRIWAVLASAGLLLGLGVLTRSTALGFVPLVMLWLARGKGMPLRRRLTAPAIVLGVCVVVILPWIARNYVAYGRFIPVDTTGGYNLWLGSIGVRDEARLEADLRTIPNPADRQSYAYEQAFKTIAADPVAFIGKGVKESLDLWRPLFSAEERQVRGFSLGRVPAWHLLSLFLFDDVLYVVILVLAILGLLLAPPHPLKSLAGLWVLLWVVMSFIFFAVTRFRLPVVAFLIPWAGVAIPLLPGAFARLRALRRPLQALGALAVVAIAVLIVPAISLDNTRLGIQRWGEQGPYREAEASLKQGQVEQAIAQYLQANTDLSDTRYGLAAAYLQAGRSPDAMAQLRADDDPDRFEPSIISGEAARMAGDVSGARSFFNARVVQVAGDAPLEWAWDHLTPPPTNDIEVGSGLDIGYVRGFYGPETDEGGKQYRWSTADAEIKGLVPSEASPVNLTVELNGWRPPSAPAAEPLVQSGSFAPPASYPDPVLNRDNVWANITLTAGSAPLSDTSDTVEVRSRPFVPGGDDPRLLGLRISTVQVAEAP